MGVIIAPHGIKGEVKIKSFTETPSNFSSYKEFEDINGNKYEIKCRSVKNDILIASVSGINDRNKAEECKGLKLYVTRNTLSEIEDNEFYYEDLEGLDVIDEVTSEKIGKVEAVYNYGAGDIIEVNGELYPFNQSTIKEIDLERGYIILAKPEEYYGEKQK